tara:strand:+ start:1792 stop:2076 length:285 start_codon:yes stop_codon:yes gene_type:complete
MPKDACYHKVKARYKVFPSAYASGAIAKCRKVGATNYGTGGKKKKTKKKAEGGVIMLNNGGATMPKNNRKRASNNKNVARGCGVVMRRKETFYA